VEVSSATDASWGFLLGDIQSISGCITVTNDLVKLLCHLNNILEANNSKFYIKEVGNILLSIFDKLRNRGEMLGHNSMQKGAKLKRTA